MPDVAIEAARSSPLLSEGLGALDGLREEQGRLLGLRLEHRLVRIIVTRSPGRKVHQHRPDHRVHGYPPCPAVLAPRYREEAGQEVHVPPRQTHLLRPAKAPCGR